MPITEDELILYHHGILGQKWGIRRYQNKDGSLTRAGVKRYGTVANFNKVQKAEAKAKKDAEKAKFKAKTEAEIAKIRKKYGLEDKTETKPKTKEKPKSFDEMTNDELRSTLERARMMSELTKLNPKKVSNGEKFLNSFKNTAVPIIKDSLREPITKYLKNKFSEALGVDKDTTEDISKKLERQAKDAQNRAKIASANELVRKYGEEAKQRAETERQRVEAEREAERQRIEAEREARKEAARQRRQQRQIDRVVNRAMRRYNAQHQH